jgi:hypothetical protein
MAKLVGRKPVEIKLYDQQNGRVPLFDSASKSWITVDRSVLTSGSAFVSGSQTFIGNQTVSGSLAVTQGITGSLFGTASYADNAWALGGNTFTGGAADRVLGTLSNHHLSIYASGSRVATFTNSGSLFIAPYLPGILNDEKFLVDAGVTTSPDLIRALSDINSYSQINIQNFNSGSSASSDIIATANNGSEFNQYVNMGINSSTFSGSIGAANDAYLYSTGNDLHIGNASNKPIQFFAGGIDTDTNRKLQLNPNNLHQMTGSLDVSGSIVARSFTGSLFGTASNATTASYWSGSIINAATASYVLQAESASYWSGSIINAATASYVLQAISASYATLALTASNANTASYIENAQSASYWSGSITNSATASYVENAQTASYVQNSQTASYVLNAVSASYAQTASSADDFTVRGTLTAQTIVAQTITSSVEFITGSTRNGSLLSNTHQFTGSVGITGSLSINGIDYATTSGSASTRLTALEVFSGSYSTGSFTGSFIGRVTGSFSGSLHNLQNTVLGHIPFFTSSQVLADSVIRQLDNGTGSYSIAINQDDITTAAPEALYVYQPSSASYNVISGKGNLNNYLQLNIQNTNTGENASSDVVATANNGNESVNYINMGINSEGFTGSIGNENDAYLYSTGNHLHVGNASNFPIEFFAGGFDTEANRKLKLNPNNQHEVTGSLSVTSGVTASLHGTASWASNAVNANTASYVLQSVSASYASNADLLDGKDSTTFATTGSNVFVGSQTISGSILAKYNSYEIHVNGVDGNDTTGDGTLLNPVASITKALTLISGNRKTVIIHPGTYTESPSITTQYTVLTTFEPMGGNTVIIGTVSTSVGCTITGLAITNLTITAGTGVGVPNIINCNITGTLTKSGNATFTDIHNCDIGTACNVTGTGLVTINDGNPNFVTVNNAGANVIIKGAMSCVSPTLTAGTLSIVDSVVIAAVTYGVTTSASSVITLSNCQILTSALNAVAPVSLSGFYSILNVVYDKNNSTLVPLSATGGSTSAISYFQDINLQSTTITGSLNITGSTTQKGNSTLLGNTTLSGSITISGSVGAKADLNLGGVLRFDSAIDPGATNLTASYLFTSASNTATGHDLYLRQNDNLVKFKWLEGVLNTGILYGGVLTYSSSNFYLSSGSGIIVNHNATTGSEISPTITYVNWAASTHSISNPTSQNTYIFIDADGDLQQQTSFFTPEQYHDVLPIGRISHYGATGSLVTGVGNNMITSYDVPQQLGEFTRAFGPLKTTGFTITPQVGNLSLNIGSGTAFNLGGYYQNSPDLPSTYNSNTYVTSSIIRLYRSGSGFLFDNNGGSYYTSVNPLVYDDGTGTLATVGNGNWSIQRVFVNPVTGRSHVYYGQSIYTTYLNAVQSVATDDFVESEVTKNAYVFAGYLVMQGGAANTDLSVGGSTNAIIQAGLFRNSVGGSGGAGAAVSNINDLSDVNISTPSNGQALIYSSGNWVNGTPVSSSHATTASFALTASYISGSGGGVGFPFSGSAVITGSFLVSSSFVDFTKATYVTGSFTGSLQGTSSFATTASHALYAAYAGNSPGLTVAFTQSVAAMTWSFTHNLNTRNPLLQVYDSTYHQIVPLEIIGSDPNQATIYFDAPESGFAIASNGGTLTVNGSTARLDQISAAVTWSFQHNLATRYPNFIVYDSTDNVVIPAGIHAISDMEAEIYFAFPSTGVAIANFSGISGSINTATSSFATTASFASFALNATSASHAVTASYLLGQSPTSSYALTASYVELSLAAVSSSYAATASIAVSSSYALNATTASYGNNFIAGNTLTIDQSLTDYHTVPSSIVGSNNMFNLATGSYSSAFFKYTVANGANARTGEVMAVWNGGSIQFTDNSTVDIGDTSTVIAEAAIAASSIQFNITTATSGWKLKSLGTFM